MASPAYELFEELGRGEHTIVYRGYDLALGREVAVKELHASGRKDARRLKRFVKEASFLAQFEHENILRIHSVDQDRGWIVMELMKGTLASQVATEAMPADMVRSVMRQILGALDFLHQKNKIHGAVRASNILINDVGTVKLSDFEAADLEGELRAPTGSKKYLAPELIRPEFGAFGPTADLYCFGFAALELLTGPKFTSFFPGTGAGAIDEDVAWLRWHSSDEPLAPVKKLSPRIPDDLAHVIDRLLSKKVDDRLPSAKETLALLSEQDFIPVIAKDAVAGVGAAPLAAAAPTSARQTGARRAAPAKVGKSTGAKALAAGSAAAAGRPKSNKSGLNAFLEKPYVLWPLCAAMLIGAVLIGLQLQDKSTGTAADEMATVNLQIQPSPDGSRVIFDGTKPSLTDEGKMTLEPGDHYLVITKDGYETYAEEVTLEKGPNDITVSLRQLTPPARSVANLRLNISPDATNARILLDSVERIPNPDGVIPVDPGEYRLVVMKDGFANHSQALTLKPGDREISIALRKNSPPPPAIARLRLLITPSADGARVLIDGQERNTNADGVLELMPGNYALEVKKEGFEPYQQNLVAETGPSEIAVALRKVPPPQKVARVRLTIRPDSAGARILFDDIERRLDRDGIVELAPRQYRLTVAKNGFEPYTKVLDLSDGLTNLEIDLVESSQPPIRPPIRPRVSLAKLNSDFQKAYFAKFADPTYVAWKSVPGRAASGQEPFREEGDVKRLRSQMAALVELPAGVRPTRIPTVPGTGPDIDGAIRRPEWAGAKEEIIGGRTTLRLLATNDDLYLGCAAPEDTTNGGMDSMGFFFHIGLTELIDNEHIYVSRASNNQSVGGVRETNIRWNGRPPLKERWMKDPIKDRLIFRQARGDTSVAGGHRQYELKLNLEEAGLHPGVPFRAWLRVEGDPVVNSQGQFVRQNYIGQLGTDEKPHWFVIEP